MTTCPASIADDRVLSALWRYWEEKRGSRPLPCRRDLDPVDIPSLLPHLMLVERTAEGRFRYRLAGTAVIQAYGRELTGRLIDEVIPEPRRVIAQRHYTTVFTAARPIFVRNRYTAPNATDFVVSRIMLPLATEAGDVVHLVLIGQTFEYSSAFVQRLGGNLTIDTAFDRIEFLDE
jgi:hypothetical protein